MEDVFGAGARLAELEEEGEACVLVIPLVCIACKSLVRDGLGKTREGHLPDAKTSCHSCIMLRRESTRMPTKLSLLRASIT